MTKPRIGVFGIGLAAYWPQFEGLRERLEGYQRGLEAKLAELGADVVSAGLVDTPRARARPARCSPRAGVELVLVYTATYATSSQVLPAVQAAKAPVVILNLQPTRSLDYEAMTTGEWLANCSACCVPELAGAFTRARVPYRTVTGTLLDGDPAWDAIARLGRRRRAPCAACARARLGFLGHTYPGMLDMYSDFTQVHAQTGAHVEVLEIDDLVARVEAARRRRDRAQGRGDPRAVRPRRPRRRPDRRRDHARELRVVGPRRRRARPARRGLRARRPDLLLPRRRRQRQRARHGRADRRQLAAHRARHPGLGRGRPEDERRDAADRPPRRRRLLHRVLRARLRRGVRADGPRRPGPRRRSRTSGPCCARSSSTTASRARGSRSSSRCGSGRSRSSALADRGRTAQAARRRGRGDRRADLPDRQHELAHPLRARPGRVHGRLVRRGPDAPRRARRSATSSAASARSRDLLGLELAVVGVT